MGFFPSSKTLRGCKRSEEGRRPYGMERSGFKGLGIPEMVGSVSIRRKVD